MAFGLLHSLLASQSVKRRVADTLGERPRNGLYRAFFNTQSLVTFGMLYAYARRLPNQTLYEVHGAPRVLMHAGQAAGLALAVSGARRVGMGRITGIDSFRAWLHDESIPPEPEAQGPAPDDQGRLDDGGPFRHTRHPLNLSPLPVFWLWPRMTTNLLAFNLVATAYLVLGSRHEEARLLAAYGDRYKRYQQSGVPFYFPHPAYDGKSGDKSLRLMQNRVRKIEEKRQ